MPVVETEILMKALPSEAERKAAEAQSLFFLSRFSLTGVRNDLVPLLNEIGRSGIFAEYTRHDISHIDTLLGMLEWIVVPQAREVMTTTDWMLIVLAIYFHDAGLIVTKSEFLAREQSKFPGFRSSILNTSEASAYKERVERLSPDEQERFLYQEFVRTHHAERIKLWIKGEPSDEYGVAHEARDVIQKMVSNLDEGFREDLALICASHHSDNLNDLSLYNPRRAYGSAIQETANLQFSAILLRTVDLLHVTKDRTPSVAFRLATPSDPKSVEEWNKQMSVVSVRKSPPRDDQGKVDPQAIPDTIAVSGTFHDPLGFFSLTEYLSYAEKQLKQSYYWADQTVTREALNFAFPWKKIDSSQVRAVGFESKQFAFELDKPKILKLLTGHTLYSNSNIVVRELVQNSLDATRLQADIDHSQGEIALHLDSVKRVLTVDDNGTGMTQKIIEDHFLNVGSSRYQDESFRKQFPNFSAISRFGIGILSTFMISDEIEVVTKAASEGKARNISIRSINGQYLIRLLDPSDPTVPPIVRVHGTRLQLKLRAGVQLPNLKEIAELWILFPGCKVTVQVDSGPISTIGYASPKHALESAIIRAGLPVIEGPSPQNSKGFRVIEREKDGLQVAFAVEWQPIYRNWTFVSFDKLNNRESQEPASGNVIGVCVQGVRVESSSPGFAGAGILAISNATGSQSPATNVARSSLEVGKAADEMLTGIYEFYAEHIKSEIDEMYTKRMYSISNAASEGRYLLSPLMAAQPTPQSKDASLLLKQSLKRIQWFTLDRGETRSLVTVEDLVSLGQFWTIESSAYASAENFVRRMSKTASLSRLVELSGAAVMIPDGCVVSGYADSSRVLSLLAEEFEVSKVVMLQTERQANLLWSRRRKGRGLWRGLVPHMENQPWVDHIFSQLPRIMNQRIRLFVLQDSDEVEFSGVDDYCGFLGSAQTMLFAENDLHRLLADRLDAVEKGTDRLGNYVLSVLVGYWLLTVEEPSVIMRSRVVEQIRQALKQQLNLDSEITSEMRELTETFTGKLFDPMSGDRLAQIYPFVDQGSFL